jgi:hypothetical protein
MDANAAVRERLRSVPSTAAGHMHRSREEISGFDRRACEQPITMPGFVLGTGLGRTYELLHLEVRGV